MKYSPISMVGSSPGKQLCGRWQWPGSRILGRRLRSIRYSKELKREGAEGNMSRARATIRHVSKTRAQTLRLPNWVGTWLLGGEAEPGNMSQAIFSDHQKCARSLIQVQMGLQSMGRIPIDQWTWLNARWIQSHVIRECPNQPYSAGTPRRPHSAVRGFLWTGAGCPASLSHSARFKIIQMKVISLFGI